MGQCVTPTSAHSCGAACINHITRFAFSGIQRSHHRIMSSHQNSCGCDAFPRASAFVLGATRNEHKLGAVKMSTRRRLNTYFPYIFQSFFYWNRIEHASMNVSRATPRERQRKGNRGNFRKRWSVWMCTLQRHHINSMKFHHVCSRYTKSQLPNIDEICACSHSTRWNKCCWQVDRRLYSSSSRSGTQETKKTNCGILLPPFIAFVLRGRRNLRVLWRWCCGGMGASNGGCCDGCVFIAFKRAAWAIRYMPQFHNPSKLWFIRINSRETEGHWARYMEM